METPGKSTVSYSWLLFSAMRAQDTTEAKSLSFMRKDLYPLALEEA